jgi:hypothetical protein
MATLAADAPDELTAPLAARAGLGPERWSAGTPLSRHRRPQAADIGLNATLVTVHPEKEAAARRPSAASASATTITSPARLVAAISRLVAPQLLVNAAEADRGLFAAVQHLAPSRTDPPFGYLRVAPRKLRPHRSTLGPPLASNT